MYRHPFDCTTASLERIYCKQCNFDTHFVSDFKRHLKKGHAVGNFNPPLRKCEKCSFTTHSIYLRVRHRLFAYCNEKQPNTRNEGVQESQNGCSVLGRGPANVAQELSGTSEVFYKCPRCDFTTRSPEIRTKHMKADCGSFKGKSRRKSSNSNQWFYCQECWYGSRSVTSLAKHVKTCHPKIQHVKCASCHFRTKTDNSLQVVKQCSNCCFMAAQRKCCRFCWFTTNNCQQMKQHYKKLHPNVKHYKCNICGYRAKLASLFFKMHIQKMHMSRTNPTKCMVCSYKGQNRDELLKHLIRHHTAYYESRNYKCQLCSLEFETKILLKGHALREHIL